MVATLLHKTANSLLSILEGFSRSVHFSNFYNRLLHSLLSKKVDFSLLATYNDFLVVGTEKISNIKKSFLYLMAQKAIYSIPRLKLWIYFKFSIRRKTYVFTHENSCSSNAGKYKHLEFYSYHALPLIDNLLEFHDNLYIFNF